MDDGDQPRVRGYVPPKTNRLSLIDFLRQYSVIHGCESGRPFPRVGVLSRRPCRGRHGWCERRDLGTVYYFPIFILIYSSSWPSVPPYSIYGTLNLVEFYIVELFCRSFFTRFPHWSGVCLHFVSIRCLNLFYELERLLRVSLLILCKTINIKIFLSSNFYKCNHFYTPLFIRV